MRLQNALHRWAAQGIDFVQLREKVLEDGELFELARHATQQLRTLGSSTPPRLLVNSRADIAAAARADGVHLSGRPGELTPSQLRNVFHAAGLRRCLVSRSCHTLEEIAAARQAGVDLILFAPVFEKQVAGVAVGEGRGLRRLQQAVARAHPVPLLALGGVTVENTPACLRAGAAGIAAIRLFS